MTITWISDENVVITKWLPKIDSVKRFSVQTGVLIGTGNAFLRQRFRFARQVQHYRRDYWKFVREVTRASRAVTFVATETLKNVLKPQGSHLCKHWWTYPTCAPVLPMDYHSTLLCSINIQSSYYSFILFYIFSSFMKWQFASSCSTSTSSSKLLTWKLTRQTSMATIYNILAWLLQASLT